MGAHILVIEDDATMSGLLRLYLEREGYRVSVASDGTTGLAAAMQGNIDLLLLDLMLPGLDGWQVCRTVRDHTPIPIILLTALDLEEQKVQGFDLGADDYVTKPFSTQELLARVRARLRPRPVPTGRADALLVFPDLVVDPKKCAVTVSGKGVDLTPKEFQLLHTLAREPGRVFTHRELVQLVWNYPSGTDDHTLRTHVQRLRRKLEGLEREYVHTVWGTGYKFEVSPR
ncbi:MAG TPA: response regulator transcription factor [Symbiobacteriaceae bacterium]|nr:response regulator transcription factor [Symbiobacteriaceae bacterium]